MKKNNPQNKKSESDQSIVNREFFSSYETFSLNLGNDQIFYKNLCGTFTPNLE